MKKGTTTLVVGATGQLGSAIVGKLHARALKVRALVREGSACSHLDRPGIELVKGDLRDPESLKTACIGAEAIIATANAATPTRKGDSFKSVDIEGYRHLIDAAVDAGVKRFIYCSAKISGELDGSLPISRAKRATEDYLMKSGFDYTIFRPDAFMDIYFAFLGSDLPARGAQNASLNRPFPFMQKFYNGVKNNIALKGEAGIIGDGNIRQTFICIDDVAEFHVHALELSQTKNRIFDIGGPEALSARQLVDIYAEITGKTLKVKSTPAFVFNIMRHLLKPFNPAAANIMALNYAGTRIESVLDMSETASLFGVQLTSARDFLKSKATLPG